MTREEAINELIEMCKYINGNIEIRSKQYKALNMAIEALKQPERKRGKWKQQTEPLGAYEVECAVCSVCNECFDLAEDYSIEDIRELFAYFPSCGAKMDEED